MKYLTKALKAVGRLLAAMALLWLCWLLGLCLFQFAPGVCRVRYFSWGLGAFVVGLAVLHFCRFEFLYVLGHELTHWVAAKMFFKKTGAIKLGSSGGSVEVAGSNIWITLAPYIVPFYTMVAMGCFGLVLLAVPQPNDIVLTCFACLFGATYAQHVAMTFFVLKQVQSDLKMYGYLVSIPLILCGNLLCLLAMVLLLTGQWAQACHFLADNAKAQWEFLIKLKAKS